VEFGLATIYKGSFEPQYNEVHLVLIADTFETWRNTLTLLKAQYNHDQEPLLEFSEESIEKRVFC
jgi:hypothetical protein